MSDEDDDVDVARFPCTVCQRQFSEAALAKHQPICMKNARKRRKIFDSSKQRSRELQIPLSKPISTTAAQEREYKLAQVLERKNQWRKKHEEFISSIRAAKEYTMAKKTGAPLPPPPPPSVDPSLVQCKWCSRRFNEKAAERHIKFCEEKHKNIQQQVQKRGRGIPRPTVAPAHLGDGRGDTPGQCRKPSTNSRPTLSPVNGGADPRADMSTNVHNGRGSISTGGRRGLTSQNKYARATPNYSTRSSRDALSYQDNPSINGPSPTFGSDELPNNCPRSLASGRARYVPLSRPADLRQMSIVSPPAQLNIGQPKPQSPRSPNPAHCRTRQSSQYRDDSGDDQSAPSDRQQYPFSSTWNESILSTVPTDSTSTNSAPTFNESLALSKRHGLVLRSGRTYEDYVQAREFARDLVQSESKIPVKLPATERIGGHVEASISAKPPSLVPYSNTISGDDTSNTSSSTKQPVPRKPLNSSCIVSQDRSSEGASGLSVHVDLDSSTETASYTQPTFSRPGQDLNRPNRTPNIQHGTDSCNRKPEAKVNKFCYECGSQFPNASAKFCPECGIRRLAV
ncbi:hypothetical protein CRM22_000374 [Opisthorchis felineus]|uniref:C2HC/C3H-type domain-containing protein n=2 Tax=Opisthorchis felineus TaxID=147828 RepID=A0A4V3SHA1_OPIFE|nr:hypothetical protein CRM22_000374 [Opisthorchis felineus]